MKERTLTIKRVVAFFVMAALVLTAAFALSGCMSKEQQAEAGLKTLLDEYKDGAADSLSQADFQELSALGLDPNELVSIMTEDFSYDIKGSKEDSSANTVNVEVTIHSKQITEAIKNVLPDMLSYVLGAARTTTQSDMQKQMTTMIVDQLKSEEPTETTVTVPMAEVSGEWIPTAQGEQVLTSALIGDMEALEAELTNTLNNY